MQKGMETQQPGYATNALAFALAHLGQLDEALNLLLQMEPDPIVLSIFELMFLTNNYVNLILTKMKIESNLTNFHIFVKRFDVTIVFCFLFLV